MSNIDEVLAAAKAKSAEVVPLAAPAAQAPAPVNAALPSYNMSAEAFLNPGGMEVKSYVQVKDAGIKLDKAWQGYIDEFEAVIDLNDVQFFMGIRKEVGSTVTYAKTYDGVSTPRGENFALLVEQFKRESQKPADTYRGADIPMILTASTTDPKDKSKVLDEGDVVGLSTSITGFKPWASFHRKLVQAGQGQAVVKVMVKHSARKNAANQDYGVCEFELLEILQPDSVAA